ncbi:MAG: hypothetical protein RR275_05215 [Lachnospiraceae bacterium]
MKIINKSRKIIAINNEALLPGKDMELPEGFENHPSITNYLKEGVIADVNAAVASSSVSGEVSDFERAKIAEEAIAKYKAEQEAAEAVKAEKEAEIKAVKEMKKPELITKAMGMGIEANESDTVDVLKDKIITALSE